jgi:hypothetical protein
LGYFFTKHFSQQLLLLFNDIVVIANKNSSLFAKKKYDAELVWDLELAWIQELDPQGLFGDA